VAVKQWFDAGRLHPTAVNIVTLGAHARRSRAVYQYALTDSVDVGVIAIEDPAFVSDPWWQTSQGFDLVLGETAGLVYWWLFGGE
jgi:hypothetical protein